MELKNRAIMIGEVVHYFETDSEFMLTDEKYHQYSSLIISPRHIKILKNKSNLSNANLKLRIVEEWFSLESADIRISNNAKRRSKRSLELNKMGVK